MKENEMIEHTPSTITGRQVRLWDGRTGTVQSAYGTSTSVSSIDVKIAERPFRVVRDLGIEDVTVLPN